MRETQMVTYPSLTMVPYSPNALYYYGILITFANIDILGNQMENNVFPEMNLVKTNAINQKFENFDIGS